MGIDIGWVDQFVEIARRVLPECVFCGSGLISPSFDVDELEWVQGSGGEKERSVRSGFASPGKKSVKGCDRDLET